jgi:site-specific DNA-methyltransferase (adenine-specific)
MKMSTQVDLFTTVEPTSVSPAIAKPFVSRSTFYQGDCLVEMDKIADKSVDMILCDLPYGTTACKWDSILPLDILWKHYERILKDDGVIALTASQPFTSNLVMSNINWFKYEWIWHKNMGGNFMAATKQPMKQHESILVFYKKFGTYNFIKEDRMQSGLDRVRSSPVKGGGAKDESVYGKRERTIKKYDDKRFPQSVQFFNVERGLHSTQKPVPLMEYLIKTYTNEGETVLDNCMGSGTTGVACKKTGRHFIGIEKDEKYFEIAVSRVSAYCG